MSTVVIFENAKTSKINMKCTSHEIDKPNLKMINFQREDDVYA